MAGRSSAGTVLESGDCSISLGSHVGGSLDGDPAGTAFCAEGYEDGLCAYSSGLEL
jgi:hypothetical protein